MLARKRVTSRFDLKETTTMDLRKCYALTVEERTAAKSEVSVYMALAYPSQIRYLKNFNER